MADETKTVLAGATVTVYLSGGTQVRRRRAPDLPGTEGPPREERPPPPVEISLYHIHTFQSYLSSTGLNEYTQERLEASIFLGDGELARLRSYIVAHLDAVEIGGSGRTAWSQARASSDSTETDGLLATMYFTRVDNGFRESRPFISCTETWAKAVPPAVQLADLDAQIERDEAKYLAGDIDEGYEVQWAVARRAEIAAYSLESWTRNASRYIGREGTMRAHLVDGLWSLGFDSGRHCQPWEANDSVNYIVTESIYPSFNDASEPTARVGATQATRVEIFAAPQLWQYLVQWEALYAIGTLWFVSIVAIPQTGTFVDALPLLPRPYSLAGPGFTGGNSEAISLWVEGTLTYGRMLAADDALNTISPFFFIILVQRIGGRVSIIELDQPARSLCAMLRVYENGSTAHLTRFIHRRTVLNRAGETVDVVPLQTDLVTGFDILDVA